jgi:hypothetical protein
MKHQIMNECKRANATGVQQLLNGQLSEAVNEFTHTLHFVKGILADYDDEGGESEMDVDQQSSSHETPMATIPAHESVHISVALPLPRKEVASNSPDTLSVEWERAQYLYKTPLQISDSAEFSSYDSTVELSVAIMFNLALAHHLNALQMGTIEERNVVLHQAITLYELAYTVQMQEDLEVSVECTMAIINNLGQIHNLVGNQEKASRCFSHLLSTILLVQSYGDAAEQTEVFVRSVSHLILKEVVAPAA